MGWTSALLSLALSAGGASWLEADPAASAACSHRPVRYASTPSRNPSSPSGARCAAGASPSRSAGTDR